MTKLFFRVGRILLISCVIVFISVNAYIVLSGRFYLYKGIANTYLVGKSGPSIYDKEIFESSELVPQSETEWIHHKKYNTAKVPKELRTYLEDIDTRAYLVFSADSLLYEEYWDKHDASTVSNSFSMAKTLVSILVGIAAEEGAIQSLDESVSNYLPEFKENGREVITIRHLLTMSSGLSWSESGSNPLSDNAESYYGDELRELVLRQRLESEPGKVFNYQSGNTQLLAYVLEEATGKDLTEYANDKVWSKIGATDKAFWNLDREGGDEKAFCCLYATARDFARLGLLLHHKGNISGEQIIPSWYYSEMICPADLTTADGTPNQRYGLHVWTFRGLTNPAHYFRGIKGQYIISMPKEDLLIVRLGEKRMPIFEIPDHLKNDEEYVHQNNLNVGHPLGLFQYIALAKMIKSQSKL